MYVQVEFSNFFIAVVLTIRAKVYNIREKESVQKKKSFPLSFLHFVHFVDRFYVNVISYSNVKEKISLVMFSGGFLVNNGVE